MMFVPGHKQEMVEPERALKGREEPIRVSPVHLVLPGSVDVPVVEPLEEALFGMGCFWGAERLFWNVPGVVATSVGYAGGYTENPTYEEVCSGRTGHAEVVRVVFDHSKVSYQTLLQTFFEGHDPTQYMRQGNDVGTQYRSVIFTFGKDQDRIAHEVMSVFSERLRDAGFKPPVTQILASEDLSGTTPFFFAEDYHQQYLAKNPNGYCGLGGTGVSCPVGIFG